MIVDLILLKNRNFCAQQNNFHKSQKNALDLNFLDKIDINREFNADDLTLTGQFVKEGDIPALKILIEVLMERKKLSVFKTASIILSSKSSQRHCLAQTLIKT